jgi:hypothetical protein
MEQVKQWADQVMASAECAECFWHDYEARPLAPSGRWTDRDGNEVRNPQAAFRGYATRWKSNNAKAAAAAPKPKHQPLQKNYTAGKTYAELTTI